MLNLAILILLVWTGNVCEHLHQVQNVHETCICLAACKIPQVCQVGFAGCVRNVCWVAFQPFLLPWTCLVPLPDIVTPLPSTATRASTVSDSLPRWYITYVLPSVVHLPVCDCTAGISDHLKPARVTPRVWAPPSLQNWLQPSPPPPPHCPIVQASLTSNWVLHTFSS